jgi:hypothetical protein
MSEARNIYPLLANAGAVLARVFVFTYEVTVWAANAIVANIVVFAGAAVPTTAINAALLVRAVRRTRDIHVDAHPFVVALLAGGADCSAVATTTVVAADLAGAFGDAGFPTTVNGTTFGVLPEFTLTVATNRAAIILAIAAR